MIISKTYSEVFSFYTTATTYLVKNKETETLLSKCINACIKKLKPAIEEFNEKRDIIGANNCATQSIQNAEGKPTVVLLKDEKGGYRFTKEGEIAYKKQVKKLIASTVEIEPVIAERFDVSGLTELEIESFNGFVINTTTE